MPAPLPIRRDLSPAELRRLARHERDGRVSARLHALAHALEGVSRGEAARLAGMGRQTLSGWVGRFNRLGVDGLRDRPGSGRRCRLPEGQQASLRAIVLRGPGRGQDGLSRYTLRDLCRIVEERFGVRYAEGGMLRLVQSLELSHQGARPAAPQADPAAQRRFKKACRA